jgi:small nuclear ribonucleoprotein (snRNP)-like protein
MPVNESPYQSLQKYIGKKVRVDFKDPVSYEGILYRMENSMHEGIGNIFLINANKVDQNKEEFDWLLIRGNTIFMIYLTK